MRIEGILTQARLSDPDRACDVRGGWIRRGEPLLLKQRDIPAARNQQVAPRAAENGTTCTTRGLAPGAGREQIPGCCLPARPGRLGRLFRMRSRGVPRGRSPPVGRSQPICQPCIPHARLSRQCRAPVVADATDMPRDQDQPQRETGLRVVSPSRSATSQSRRSEETNVRVSGIRLRTIRHPAS